MAGHFVISLDFELMWGVRDHSTKAQYGGNVLGERQAIPAMLAVFEAFKLRTTWATVGMVFAGNKDELLAYSPQDRPTYENPKLSSYAYFDEVGRTEAEDPYYFGADLIAQIRQHDGQEIGSHTFSHYYCLEPGQTTGQFAADMEAAVAIAAHRGIELRSFVFPRNQYSGEHLAALKASGLCCIRGNEQSWIYKATAGAAQTKALRMARLADNYANLSGYHVHDVRAADCGLHDVPASRFLRPYAAVLKILEPLRLRRMKQAMTAAATEGKIFHLWWHPHNFGRDLDANIAVLRELAEHYRELADTYGMKSSNMGDLA